MTVHAKYEIATKKEMNAVSKKIRAVSRALRTPKGRAKLAKAMKKAAREQLKEQSFGDLLIALSAKDGILTSSRCCIYVRNGSGTYQRVGMLEDFKVAVNARQHLVKVEVVMTGTSRALSKTANGAIRSSAKLLKPFKNLKLTLKPIKGSH